MRYSILLLLFIFVGCSTAMKTAGPSSDKGLWQGKVLMTNHKSNNKKWANVAWASDSSVDKMRIDVYAIMDFPLATFIKNGSEAHLWLFTEQKYFYSQDSEKLFQHLTKINLNPTIFYSLLGVPRAPNKNWDCTKNEDQFDCLSKADKLSLSVENSDNDLRVIKILKDEHSLRLRLNRSKVQLQDNQFDLLPTSQFKTIKI